MPACSRPVAPSLQIVRELLTHFAKDLYMLAFTVCLTRTRLDDVETIYCGSALTYNELRPLERYSILYIIVVCLIVMLIVCNRTMMFNWREIIAI
jgi:hypothetical protein